MKDHTIPLTPLLSLVDGEFHSGEQLGEQLGMSRAAITKHIQTYVTGASMCLLCRARVTACRSLFIYR